MAKLDEIINLLEITSQSISLNDDNWKSFLDTASNVYQRSFEEQILIHAQRPDATVCYSFDTWNDKLHRWIKRGAKGIALLDDNGRYTRLKYVFDLSDTRSPHNQELQRWIVTEDIHQDLVELIQTEHDLAYHPKNLALTLIQYSFEYVQDLEQDYVEQLEQVKEATNFEYMETYEIKDDFSYLLEQSIAYCLCKRCDLDTDFYFELKDFEYITMFQNKETLAILGTACQEISEHLLCEIGKMARDITKNKRNQNRTFDTKGNIIQNRSEEKERGEQDDATRNQIYDDRGLSISSVESGREITSRQIRHDEETVSKETPTGKDVDTKDEQTTSATFDGSPTRGNAENGRVDETVSTKASSSRQRETSDGVGTTHEQPSSDGGGDHTQRNHLQLDLDLGDIEVKEEIPEIPPFSMDNFPFLLRSDDILRKPKEEIIHYFQTHSDPIERIEYLEKEVYDDTYYTIQRNARPYDTQLLGQRMEHHGLIVWTGNYLTRDSERFISMYDVQENIAQLIEKGEYLHDPYELMTPFQQSALFEVVNSNVERVILSRLENYRVSSSEIIDYFQTHPNQEEQAIYVQEIYHKGTHDFDYEGVKLGYETSEDGLTIYLGTSEHRKAELFYQWNSVATHIESLILIRYFDPSIQLPTVEEQKNAVYQSLDDFNQGRYFSQKEIERTLQTGSSFQDGKFRIYAQMLKHESTKENADFLRREYGVGGSSSAFIGSHIHESHDGKGITLEKQKWIGETDYKITLKWNEVAKRIAQLVENDRYLNAKEKEEYPKYLEKQIEQELQSERRQIAEELGVSDSNIEFPPIKKELHYQVGDSVYLGQDEFVIQEISDTIYVSDRNFPLFSETFLKEEFEEAIAQSPLNNHWYQEIIDVEIIEDKPQEETTTLPPYQWDDTLNEYGNLLKQYYHAIKEEIEESYLYDVLRDHELDVDGAEETLRSELPEFILKYPEVDVQFHNNDAFQDALIQGLIKDIYEDYSNGIDYSSFEVTSNAMDDANIYHELYDKFDSLARNITEHKSGFMTLLAGERDYSLMIENNELKPDTVEMYHNFTDTYGEHDSPYMQFIIDREQHTLRPFYYENKEMNLILNSHKSENSIFSVEEIQHQLNDYAARWFHNLIDKQYHVVQEEYYRDETREDTWDIYNENGIITDAQEMPYSKLLEYAKENGYQIEEHYREELEVDNLVDVLGQLHIYDMEVSWDDDLNQIIAGDGDNLWQGREFYDFLFDEVINYEDGKPTSIDQTSYDIMKDFYQLAPEIKKEVVKTDYVITDDHLGEGTPKQRYQKNINAIRVLKQIESQNRLATPEEQEVLSQYVGWGGLADAFDSSKSSWSKEYLELKELLTDEEYASARESTLSAFYTSPIVIDSMYQALEKMGFRYGNILEPSCGTGRFFGKLLETLHQSKLYGIELDSLTGRIAKQLYQNVNIAIEGYEQTNLPDNFFDVIIGNIPFGQFKVSDKKYDNLNFNIHDYFFAKSIDKVRPGGIIAFVTSRYTMDKKNSSVRKYINERCELVGGYSTS